MKIEFCVLGWSWENSRWIERGCKKQRSKLITKKTKKNTHIHKHTQRKKEERSLSASISLCHSAIYRNFRRSRMTQSSTKSWNSKQQQQQQQQQSQKKKRLDEITTAAKPQTKPRVNESLKSLRGKKQNKNTHQNCKKKPQLWSFFSLPFSSSSSSPKKLPNLPKIG